MGSASALSDKDRPLVSSAVPLLTGVAAINFFEQFNKNNKVCENSFFLIVFYQILV